MFVWTLIAALLFSHRLAAAQQPWLTPSAQQWEENLLRLGWKLKPHTAEQAQFNQIQEQQLQQLFRQPYYSNPQQIPVQLQQQQPQQNLFHQAQSYQYQPQPSSLPLQQPNLQQLWQPLPPPTVQPQIQPLLNVASLSTLPQQQPQPAVYLQPTMRASVQQPMEPIPIPVKSQPRQPQLFKTSAPTPVTTPTLPSPAPLLTPISTNANPPVTPILATAASEPQILLPSLPTFYQPLQALAVPQQLLPAPLQPVPAQVQLLPAPQPMLTADNTVITDKSSNLQKNVEPFIVRRKRQSFPPQPAPYQPRVEDYNLPPFYQPYPGRDASSLSPIFPFTSQFNNGLDVNPGTRITVDGNLNVPIMGWGIWDYKGGVKVGRPNTRVGFGSLVRPTNVLGITPETIAVLGSNGLFNEARRQLPSLPVAVLPGNFVPLRCKPPFCNPFLHNLGFGVDVEPGDDVLFDGGADFPIPLAPGGVGVRYPLSGAVNVGSDPFLLTYGHGLGPVEPPNFKTKNTFKDGSDGEDRTSDNNMETDIYVQKTLLNK